MKTFLCSIQLSIIFQMLIKLKYLNNKAFLAQKLSYVEFILTINVKMASVVDILTYTYEQNKNHAQLSMKTGLGLKTV